MAFFYSEGCYILQKFDHNNGVLQVRNQEHLFSTGIITHALVFNRPDWLMLVVIAHLVFARKVHKTSMYVHEQDIKRRIESYVRFLKPCPFQF
jgi:hypothetical protein